jgi:hypothetical protein
VSKRIGRVAVAMLIAAGLVASVATAAPRTTAKHTSSHLMLGINDEAFTLYGDNPASAFETLQSLGAKVLRVNLYWGGNKWAVANSKPSDPADPGDQAYDWSLYDRLARYAASSGIKLVLSIVGTPSWANHGAGRNHAPTSYKALQDFAHAAAIRYSGYYVPPAWQQDSTLAAPTDPLPLVTMWTAWNEPNNPVFLAPQYKRVRKTWRVQSAYDYARICNAVYTGIHAAMISAGRPVPGEKVACGVTDPRGNDNAGSSRASVDPLSFLIAAHRYGMKKFDVYAHNPYASAGNEAPSYVPKGRFARRIQLGNIGKLLSEITRFYGRKHLWITEYGYQTNPPDRTILATSPAKQAAYLKQAYTIAKKNPRIDMVLWFLVRDQPQITGWQSGLETVSDVHKPAWNVFQGLAG